MKQTFEYGQYSYEYYIEFGERKSLTLVVRPDLRIIVRVPLGTTLAEIEAFLKRKWRWLEKQLRELRKYSKAQADKKYVSGESFRYLGRQYMLEVQSANYNDVKLEHGKLHVYTTKSLRNSAHNQELIEEWYSRKRTFVFRREFNRALSLFDFDDVPKLRQRHMARRWGSYTNDNKVLLNPRLIQAPREAIYYVCMHELCHKISKKHDEKFYDALEKRIPNWRRIKEHLEINYG